MKHIVITGERGVGKSTLALRLCRESGAKVCGFSTLCTQRDEKGMHKVYIVPARSVLENGPERALSLAGEDCLVGCSDMARKHSFPEVFDVKGAMMLNADFASENGRNLILMDEIGFMEKDSPKFIEAVLKAFDGDVPVIAVLKKHCDEYYSEIIRKHPRAVLYELTEENRNELFKDIFAVLSEDVCFPF